MKTHTRDEKRHIVDENLQRADVVLCLDGYNVPCEKSDGTSEQKQNYDYMKSSQPLMRIIEVCTLSGVVVQVSSATGGRTSEVEIALSLKLLERIEEEAQQSGRHVRLHLVLDRGFYDYKNKLSARPWSHVTLTFSIPYHLIKPGKKSAAELAAGLRKQHRAEEVEWNRTVASERWINEVSVGGINHARFLHRMLDLTTVHLIDDYLIITVFDFATNCGLWRCFPEPAQVSNTLAYPCPCLVGTIAHLAFIVSSSQLSFFPLFCSRPPKRFPS